MHKLFKWLESCVKYRLCCFIKSLLMYTQFPFFISFETNWSIVQMTDIHYTYTSTYKQTNKQTITLNIHARAKWWLKLYANISKLKRIYSQRLTESWKQQRKTNTTIQFEEWTDGLSLVLFSFLLCAQKSHLNTIIRLKRKKNEITEHTTRTKGDMII